MFVNRLELMRQRVHARDGQPEVGVELVGDAESVGLEAEPQEPPIAVVGEGGIGDGQIRDVGWGQRNPPELFRPLPDEPRLHGIRTIGADGLHPHRLAEQRPAQHLSLSDRAVSIQR